MSPEYVRPYVKAQKNDDRDGATTIFVTSRPARSSKIHDLCRQRSTIPALAKLDPTPMPKPDPLPSAPPTWRAGSYREAPIAKPTATGYPAASL